MLSLWSNTYAFFLTSYQGSEDTLRDPKLVPKKSCLETSNSLNIAQDILKTSYFQSAFCENGGHFNSVLHQIKSKSIWDLRDSPFKTFRQYSKGDCKSDLIIVLTIFFFLFFGEGVSLEPKAWLNAQTKIGMENKLLDRWH